MYDIDGIIEVVLRSIRRQQWYYYRPCTNVNCINNNSYQCEFYEGDVMYLLI